MVVHEHYLEDVDRNRSDTVPGMYNMDMVVAHNTSPVGDPLEFVVGAQPLLHIFFCVLIPPRSREVIGTTSSTLMGGETFDAAGDSWIDSWMRFSAFDEANI
ncbi:hypothetical protein RIF29_18490 [Crotalaria pallida]|uniref:Uncharacterized protein n=1 Tax=Crotalaria pallida TaxID=3830 RepID=A0AAN9FKJ2_CROPI